MNKLLELRECSPWGGRHKWSVFFCNHPNGKIWYCQFCFIEKLIKWSKEENKLVTEIYERGTYYGRAYKKTEKKTGSYLETFETNEEGEEFE